MNRVAQLLVLAAALLSLVAGGRYMTTAEFMPYHAVVAGQSWASLPPGLQAVILGMLRILAGGFLACGLSLLVFAYAAYRNVRAAYAAALAVGLTTWLPVLLVTLMLESVRPAASPPTAATAVILALVLLGAGIGLVAPPRAGGAG